MNVGRSARAGRTVDRAEAERLLDQAGVDAPPATAEPLARLLAAAAAPARPGELAGEQAAVVAFRAARAAGVPAPAVVARRGRRLTTGVVTWIAALAATATAGVAFAAVTRDGPAERVPGPAPSSTTATPTAAGSARPTPQRSGPVRQDPTRRPPSGPGGAPSAPGTVPGPGGPAGTAKVTGQCRAYLAKSPEQREKALTKPGFAEVVAAAGGADRVEAYCRQLVPGRPPGAPSAGPGGGPGRKN
ncbi:MULTISPECIES: hypothetical protein [Micromonospora]|uniref:Uncharacterized protein n=1 Tax=Micromonospora antibiotica TaxID=2807623 RepID=A0ABS3VHW9_9ACTN|nr:hypothetical protein [Micromonospora antibiotica]MBO4165211.1 hypothetical protein [Micromonospora antibiotica]